MKTQWKWSSIVEAATDIVEDGFAMTNAKYVFVALISGEKLNVVATKGGPLPDNLDTTTQIPLVWEQRTFAVIGKSRNSKNWADDWLAQVAFILGALWHSSHSSYMQERFLSTIAHEVRNPLTGILNTIDLLLNDPTNTTVNKMYIHTIEENTAYLLSLSNDLLELHKIKTGKSIPNPTPVEIRGLLASISSMCSNMIPAKVSIHSAVPTILLFDEVKLKQILINLIQNSKKFGASSIHLRVAWKQKDETLYLEIEDNGNGIAPENLSKLFHFGFSTSGSIGLGLSLSKSLLQVMKGNIYVKQSSVGVGTTMALHFRAPLVGDKTSQANIPSQPIPIMQMPLKSVLVVDDHVSVRITIAEMIKRILPDVALDMAVDGNDAVKQFTKTRHQLIFLDLKMPNLDGWGCAAQIRQLGEPEPIIFLISAYNLTDTEKAKCRELGISGFVRKPFKISDLQLVLQRSKFITS